MAASKAAAFFGSGCCVNASHASLSSSSSASRNARYRSASSRAASRAAAASSSSLSPPWSAARFRSSSIKSAIRRLLFQRGVDLGEVLLDAFDAAAMLVTLERSALLSQLADYVLARLLQHLRQP